VLYYALSAFVAYSDSLINTGINWENNKNVIDVFQVFHKFYVCLYLLVSFLCLCYLKQTEVLGIAEKSFNLLFAFHEIMNSECTVHNRRRSMTGV